METLYYKHDGYDYIVKRVISKDDFLGDFYVYQRGGNWKPDRDKAEIVVGIDNDYHDISEEEAFKVIKRIEGKTL